MAGLPSPGQVAGRHAGLYSALYESVRGADGSVPAADAARLLKESGLPDATLSRIWDLADTGARGRLDKAGMFVALKLVALAQAGRAPDAALACEEAPPPRLKNHPAPPVDWSISPGKLAEYERVFDSLQPDNGYIPGNKVKSLLMESKLHVDTLCKIWDLADMDKDGSLNRGEFAVAMHLVYKALEKCAIPDALPPELVPANLGAAKEKPAVNGEAPWVVSAEEKRQYDALFKATDTDEDGFVSGNEMRGVLLQSGLAQPVLANIWALCDSRQSGKLNPEQFALAMWLVKRTLGGLEPPAALAPDMVPPSLRPAHAEVRPENPEMEAVARQIEELRSQKRGLEGQLLQKEADVKVKTGEAASLRGELDTLAATLRQLDGQRGEAQRRLDDLRGNVVRLETQAEQQGALVAQQQQEVEGRKQHLQRLKEEEQQLQNSNAQLEGDVRGAEESLQRASLDLAQLRGLLERLADLRERLGEADRALDTCLGGGDPLAVPHLFLQLEPLYQGPEFRGLTGDDEEGPAPPQPRSDFYSANGFNDPFASSDGFAAAFGKSNAVDSFGGDAFAADSNAAFGGSNNSAFGADNSAFGTENSAFGTNNSAFGNNTAFGGSNNSAFGESEAGDAGGGDPFGCEPFSAPALPPKNKKPPPRPAPPRPQPPKSPVPGGKVTPTPAPPSSDSFADFNAFFPKSESQSKLEFTEDPFNNYRYEDPFGPEDPFKEAQPQDPFSDK